MDDRIVEFITGLRAAGVRISVAESADALRAIGATGIADKDFFRLALRATLVKEAQDVATFEELFPQYFGPGAPPMPNQPGGGMSHEDRDKLADILEEMLRTMTPEQLRQLFEAMMRGQNMSREQMQQMLATWNAWKEKFKDHIVDWGDKLRPGGKIVSGASVSDGPFVEAKEIIGGFMIVAADSLEDAIAIAQAMPTGPGARIEVRELAGAQM